LLNSSWCRMVSVTPKYGMPTSKHAFAQVPAPPVKSTTPTTL
jgi:hypothetical protein